MIAALVVASLLAGCGTADPRAIQYKSSRKSTAPSLAAPPDLTQETPDQRFVVPTNGEATLSSFHQVVKAAPPTNTVLPPVQGMQLQRDGLQRWLLIDGKTPDQVWPQIRKFWQEQGFVLVVDARQRHIMETDWNETRARLDLGIIRDTLSKAFDNSYVAGERNRYRTRLETAPNGGTYVFISQKGMHEVLTGANRESSKWEDRPNDPGLEAEYLKRVMSTLAQNDAQAKSGHPVAEASEPLGASEAAGSAKPAMPGPAVIREDTAQAAATQISLAESYDQAWRRVGLALERNNFTIDSRDPAAGVYVIRYVDPRDISAAQMGFWTQVFHGKKEKVARQYKINVRALTQTDTRVAVIDDKGEVEDTRTAKEIMGLLAAQLG